MDESAPVRAVPTTKWSWIAGIWFAGALFDASRAVLILHAEGRQGSWMPLFGTEFVLWLPWVLATPLISRLALQFPVFRGPTVKSVVVHLVTFVTLSAAALSWSALLLVLFNPWYYPRPPTFVAAWSDELLYQILTFVIVYTLIVTVTSFMDTRDKMAHQNEELSKARLAALRRQLEPHFMYNTLNSIAGLVRDHRNDAAVNMIVGLSEFMRRASEDSQRSQVTLAEEVEYLQRYLDIQKMRLGDRLQASVNIPAALLDTQVPSLLLQPLVENAIMHGIAKRIAGGAIRVSVADESGKLCLRVYNDSPGFPMDLQATRTGVGIGNLRKRLRILYGEESDLQLRQTDADGIEVVVTLPLKVA